MTNGLTLSGKTRDDRAAKTVRRDAGIPAVLYGYKVDSTPIEINAVEFTRVFGEAGETSLIKLDLGDGKEHNVIVRDVQRHPVQDSILHVDFFQVRLDEIIGADVPLTFVGEAPAIKNLGGILVHPLDEVELEALPQNLPHDIPVDISGLDNFEKVIHVSDLKVGEGVKILNDPDEVVALIQEPKSQEELDAELSEEVQEDVEGVEGVADKEQEGEATEEGTPEESEEVKKEEE